MTSAAATAATASAPARLPSVDALLRTPDLAPLLAHYGRSSTTAALRQVLDTLRPLLRQHQLTAAQVAPAALAGQVQQQLARSHAPRLKPVFNLTGTVLHTNLGRALLPQSVIDSVAQAMASPMNLEYDLDDGGRGDRDDLVAELVCQLTGAEAATIVNNNAAAVLLTLATLAPGREVVVSRGELVEIGGAFRIPDIMAQAGCRLVEVGTTNRTHPHDYERAIGPDTALLMKVHTSNYAIQGFTTSVPDAQVASLAHAAQLPMAVDLGSGTLVDMTAWGLPPEVTVAQTVASGADVVTFSGDKLLGGPQAGIIVGRKDLVARIKRHPLKRALRVGKITLAALEATLRLYQHPETLAQRLTTLRLFTRPASAMQAQAQALAPALQAALGADWHVTPSPMASQIGSGALPVDSLDSFGLVLRPAGKTASVAQLQERLRRLPRPIIGRAQDGALWLDLRCLEAPEQAAFTEQLAALNA